MLPKIYSDVIFILPNLRKRQNPILSHSLPARVLCPSSSLLNQGMPLPLNLRSNTSDSWGNSPNGPGHALVPILMLLCTSGTAPPPTNPTLSADSKSRSRPSQIYAHHQSLHLYIHASTDRQQASSPLCFMESQISSKAAVSCVLGSVPVAFLPPSV